MTTVINDHSTVTMHFALRLADGREVDSTFDKQAATFAMGDGNLPENFEQLLVGLTTGDRKTFSVPPEKAFGQHNPNNVQMIGREQFSDMEMKEGLVVSFADAKKTELPGVVKSFDLNQVEVDFNHPLAGETLAFEVEIIDVQETA